MARPVYSYEMSDPDFAWLLETYQQNHTGYLVVQDPCMPIVLIPAEKPNLQYDISANEFLHDNPFERLLMPEPNGDEQIDET